MNENVDRNDENSGNDYDGDHGELQKMNVRI